MTQLEEIVPGVYGMHLGFVNAFVLVDDDVTLIDTGLGRSYGKISAATGTIGREINNIALTHYHFDHIGNLARLATPDRTVFVHPLDADVVRGDRAHPGPVTGGVGKAVLTLIRPLIFGRMPAGARVDRELVEGEEIPGTGACAPCTPRATPQAICRFCIRPSACCSSATPPPCVDAASAHRRRWAPRTWTRQGGQSARSRSSTSTMPCSGTAR
jgi:glyoxylase-like metal-dependent hydrolase (beta-lactamase superfamily II)